MRCWSWPSVTQRFVPLPPGRHAGARKLINDGSSAEACVSPSTRPSQSSGSSRQWQIIAILAPTLVAGGCSAAGSAPAALAPRRPAAGSGIPAATSPPRPDAGRADFTVSGSVSVRPNPSQDTHARAPAAACQPQKFRRDEALGLAASAGFTSAGAPVSAALLAHFLAGTGTAMHFGARSQISREARATSAFQDLNRHIQAAALNQLRAGTLHARLTGSALPRIRFGPLNSSQDLYLGFRGTQGLDIRGTGTITNRRYTGRLTYVIHDSYGFPPQDQLLGVGTAMRYLQVDCGSPPTQGGARWFPDSITITVPFG
jgi:hypothetical protein